MNQNIVKNNLKMVLNILGRNRRFRNVIRYVSNHVDGFSYGSYTVSDEAYIAASFLIDKRGVVIDAGANKGEYSRTLLDIVGDNHLKKLIMIEPNVYHQDSHAEIHKNYPKIVKTEWVAVGSEPSSMQLFFDSDGSGLASLGLFPNNLTHHPP